MEQGASCTEMDYDNEEECEVELTSPAAEFAMDDALAEFDVAQAEEAMEQHAILESIHSKLEVAENRHYLHKADVELEELFVTVDFNEESELRAAAGPSDTTGMEVVNIRQRVKLG